MVRNETTTGGASSGQKADDTAPLTAILVADSFDRRFAPIVDETSSLSCVRLANVKVLDYTLEWLSRTEIRDVIVVVASSHEAALSELLSQWKGSFESLKLVTCQNCMSVGDAIREVETRSMITSDFLLITNPATFCNSNLVQQIRAYRERRKESKNNVMTLIYTKSCGSSSGSVSNSLNPILGIERKTSKLLLYNPGSGTEGGGGNGASLELDKSIFITDTLIRRDLRDSGVAICSQNISAQFSDNFDFQFRDDVIREIILNEEILGLNIHVDVLPDSVAAFTVRDYEGLIRANRLILQRWLTPLLPGRAGLEGGHFITTRSNLYFGVDDEDRNVENLARFTCNNFNAGPNVVFGMNCKIGAGATIKNTALGNDVEIGENTTVVNCIVGDGTKIGRNAAISNSFIDECVCIGDDVIVYPRCVLAKRVCIPAAKSIASESVVCSEACAEDEEDIFSCTKTEVGFEWKFVDGSSFWRASSKRRERYDSSATNRGVDSTMEKSDEEDVVEKEMDNTEKFFEEVKESMERIAASDQNGEPLVRNLILEINSSKLAYNISMEDVAKNVMLAFLSLQHNNSSAALRSLVQRWKVLFENYYKPLKSQIHALIAVEEYLTSNASAFKPLAAKTVHMLYEEDVVEEDAILEWHDTLAPESQMRTLVAPIIAWLRESDDDEDEEESESG